MSIIQDSKDKQTNEPENRSNRAITWRSVLIGIICVLTIAIGVPYTTHVVKGSYMDLDFSTPAAVFLFFFVVLFINGVWKKISPKSALNPGELLIIYILMIISCAIPVMSLTGQLLPILAAPFYYMNSSNNWKEQIWPNVNRNLMPIDNTLNSTDTTIKGPVQLFYEGDPNGQVHWGAWLPALINWLPLLLALYFVMIALMVIMRRQWMNREKLSYPLTQLPIEMINEKENIFTKWVFIIGFSITFIIASLKGMRSYFPSIPAITTEMPFSIFNGTNSIMFRLSFVMIGFFFLSNLDTVFSLWFFNLLFLLIKGQLDVLGVTMIEPQGVIAYGTQFAPYKYLGTGAMIALVVGGFWLAKPHIVDVFQKAIGKRPDIDDSQEILSYKTAFWGTIAGLFIMSLWLTWSGLPFWYTWLYLFIAFCLFIGLTRVVVESGLAEAVASTIAPSFMLLTTGNMLYGAKGLNALALTWVYSADMRTSVMASTATAAALKDQTKLKLGNINIPFSYLIYLTISAALVALLIWAKMPVTTLTISISAILLGGFGLYKTRNRPLFWMIALAIILTLIGSIYMTLHLAYTNGAVTMNPWFMTMGPKLPWTWVTGQLKNPTAPSVTGWFFTFLGIIIMVALQTLRTRYVWWPFHPLGFCVGSTFIMNELWFSAFIAWLFKLAVLKSGGLKLYRTARPAFMGLIVGQFVANGVWLIIDSITGNKNNQIFWI